METIEEMRNQYGKCITKRQENEYLHISVNAPVLENIIGTCLKAEIKGLAATLNSSKIVIDLLAVNNLTQHGAIFLYYSVAEAERKNKVVILDGISDAVEQKLKEWKLYGSFRYFPRAESGAVPNSQVPGEVVYK
jgi:anti-anti-sigma regulatory factor